MSRSTFPAKLTPITSAKPKSFRGLPRSSYSDVSKVANRLPPRRTNCLSCSHCPSDRAATFGRIRSLKESISSESSIRS